MISTAQIFNTFSQRIFEVVRIFLKSSFYSQQLVRCFRYKDLYDNVLFNYQVIIWLLHCYLINFSLKFQWLYYKMCALPLPDVLGDFEDAIRKA